MCSAKHIQGQPFLLPIQQRRSQWDLSGIHTALARVSGTDFHQDQISDALRQTESLSASGCCQNASAHAREVICFSEAAAAPESSWVE